MAVVAELDFTDSTDPFSKTGGAADMSIVDDDYIRVTNLGGDFGRIYATFPVITGKRYRTTITTRQGTSTSPPAYHLGTAAEWAKYGKSLKSEVFEFTAVDNTLGVYFATDSDEAGLYNDFDRFLLEDIGGTPGLPPTMEPEPSSAVSPSVAAFTLPAGQPATVRLPLQGTQPFDITLTGAPVWASVDTTGLVTFTPPIDFAGDVTFGYTARNCGSAGQSVSSTQTVTFSSLVQPAGFISGFQMTHSLDAPDLMGLKKAYPWHPDNINNEPAYFTFPGDLGFPDKIPAGLGINPFSLIGDVAQITATRTPVSLRNSTDNRDWTTGVFSTQNIPNQPVYGVWEVDMKLDAISGAWVTFWLVQKDLNLPPEYDIELDGGRPTQIWINRHAPNDDPNDYSDETAVNFTDLPNGMRTDQWRRYRMRLTPTAFEAYVDGVLLGKVDSVHDKELFVLMNLTISNNSGFITNIRPDIPGPINLQVRRLRIWKEL